MSNPHILNDQYMPYLTVVVSEHSFNRVVDAKKHGINHFVLSRAKYLHLLERNTYTSILFVLGVPKRDDWSRKYIMKFTTWKQNAFGDPIVNLAGGPLWPDNLKLINERRARDAGRN